MIKEAKVLVRIVALWIIFMGSLYMTFLAVGNFATATITMIGGGYDYYGGYISYSATNCMTPPLYPSNSYESLNKAELDKYQADQAGYNKRTQELCNQDLQKQKENALKSEQSQEKQNRSNGTSAVAREAILMVIGFVAISLSLKEIRKIEQV